MWDEDTEQPGWLEECYCQSCKNRFWVPSYGDGAIEMELSHPVGCPFCMVVFNWIEGI